MKYILDPQDYKLPNPRIDGFRKLKEVGAKTVDIFVFSLETFEYFLKKGNLPKGFVSELKKRAEEIIKNSASHSAVVRRAFVVPGLENPPGPRFLGLSTPEAVINSVKELYEFAISQDYHKIEGSQISGWVEPPSTVVDIKKFKQGKLDFSFIPYGGYAIAQNDTAEIYAVFGVNEGVQSLVADHYSVEMRRGKFFIIEKEIPQKNLMLCTTNEWKTTLLPVPIELQFEQVLSDNEILEVARVVFALSQKYGPHRIEFSTYDEKGLCCNEVADYWKEKVEKSESFQAMGEIIDISGPEDLEKLKKVPKKELASGQKVVFINEKVVSSRNYDVLNAVAAWGNNLVVLYPGVAATQHAMRILADKGHRAFLVGTQKYKEKDRVKITAMAGKVRVTNLSRTESQEIISLWDASLFGSEVCGGKANRLSVMKISGFQVPHGSVISTVVFGELLRQIKIKYPLDISSFDKIYKKLKDPPAEIIKKIELLLKDSIKSKKFFAVRSSATIEDSAKQSMAGLFETYLYAKGTDLAEKVMLVMRSAFNKNIADFISRQKELLNNFKMAVVIQEMIKAKAAGVIFGADIRGRNLDIVEIEAKTGIAEEIVSGRAKKVEQFKFARSQKQIVFHKGPEILNNSEKKALFMLSERLRKEFNDIPQDIEWAIDKQGQIWILQSRDLIM